MTESRRAFFEEILACGALAALMTESAAASPQQSLSNPSLISTTDFWGSFYDSVDPKKSRGQKGVKGKPAVAGKDVRYLYYDNAGLRYTDQLKPTDLLDHPGDVAVSITLGQFRPGHSDAQAIRQLTSSQLRVDCVQTRSFLNLLAPAAWVAMASLYTDQAGKLPSLQTLGFQQPNLLSGDNKVILPGGSGKFSVNVSSMVKESVLHKVLRNGIKVAGIASPLLGFPAISVPAMQAFSAIYSVLEERASFIMSSPLMDAAATQAALKEPSFPPTFLPIKDGQYVMVPLEHTDALAQKMPQLDVNQGWLVDRTDKSNRPVDQKANDTIPEVSYLTLQMKITPVTLQLASTGSGGGSEGSGEGGSKSGTASKSNTVTKKK
ncbi:MAG: hypothetical protein ABSC60_01710 [Acidobacteriota bacterium]|jgi:hypothetical protein